MDLPQLIKKVPFEAVVDGAVQGADAEFVAFKFTETEKRRQTWPEPNQASRHHATMMPPAAPSDGKHT
jgi:hypothetical protein